jgi:hypothetical protein
MQLVSYPEIFKKKLNRILNNYIIIVNIYNTIILDGNSLMEPKIFHNSEKRRADLKFNSKAK